MRSRFAAGAGVALLGMALGAWGGCKSEVPPAAAPRETEQPGLIRAAEPRDMAQEVARRPVLKWRLPAGMATPEYVSVLLFEVGQAEDPRKAKGQERQVATVTGLKDTSPTELNLWNRPPGAVLTGEIGDMTQLKPDTWYRWRVRAVGNDISTETDFYFKTGDLDALPPAPARPAAGPST